MTTYKEISQVSLVVAGGPEPWTPWRSDAPGRPVPCVKEKASHDPFAVTHCLTCSATSCAANAPVAEDENQQDDDVEGREVPDAVDRLGGVTRKEDQRVADAVHYAGCGSCHRHSNDNAADPCECCRRVSRPLAQISLSPGCVNDLQIAFDADGGEVDHRTNEWTPRRALTQQHQAEPA